MIEYRATGNAAEAKIIKIEHAMISSRSVIPASGFRRARLRFAWFIVVSSEFTETCGAMPGCSTTWRAAVPDKLLLHLNRSLARQEWQRFLLGVLRIHLHDRKLRCARLQCFDHNAQKRATTADARRVWLAGRRDHQLSLALIAAFDDRNFLIAAGQES